MLVYRLEDEDGFGPFSSCKPWPEYKETKALHNQYGCTVNFPEDDRFNYRFGCHSEEAIREYWGVKIDDFLSDGWKIVVYKVRKNYVKMGGKGFELAFKADKAEKVTI